MVEGEPPKVARYALESRRDGDEFRMERMKSCKGGRGAAAVRKCSPGRFDVRATKAHVVMNLANSFSVLPSCRRGMQSTDSLKKIRAMGQFVTQDWEVRSRETHLSGRNGRLRRGEGP